MTAPERDTRTVWSSRGEVVRTGQVPRDRRTGEGYPALAPPKIRKETPIMAKEAKDTQVDAMRRTPGAEGGHALNPSEDEDVPLQLGAALSRVASSGPRDALILDGHNEQDYIPDVDGKGYHSGMVRQPAMVVIGADGRVVGFEALDESMFARQPTIQDLKAAHNAREKGKDWNKGVRDLSQEVAPTATVQETPLTRQARNPANAGAAGAGPKAPAKAPAPEPAGAASS